MTLEGSPDADLTVAGHVVKRTTRLADGLLTMDERVDQIGVEVPADRIAAARDAVARMKDAMPQLVAPVDTPRRWTLAPAAIAGSSQVKAIRAIYARAIAADADDTSGYASRASFEAGMGDHRAALADYGRVIAKQPSLDLYLQRSWTYATLGELPAALADAERARALDPSSTGAITRIAWLKAEQGDVPGPVASLDERIALGGETRATYRSEKASMLGEFGDPAEAVKLYDTLIAEKPGSPNLLNGRCWVKGTRSVALDTALKDCTTAIELSENTLAALDSRAMVWYRKGRYDEALADLDAVLAQAPDMASSRYLRAAVLKALKRDGEAATDLAMARRMSPRIDVQYARYGMKP